MWTHSFSALKLTWHHLACFRIRALLSCSVTVKPTALLLCFPVSFLSAYCFCPLDALSSECKLELAICGRRMSKLALEVGVCLLPDAFCPLFLPLYISVSALCWVSCSISSPAFWPGRALTSWTPHSEWTRVHVWRHSWGQPAAWSHTHGSNCIPASWCRAAVKLWKDTCAVLCPVTGWHNTSLLCPRKHSRMHVFS